MAAELRGGDLPEKNTVETVKGPKGIFATSLRKRRNAYLSVSVTRNFQSNRRVRGGRQAVPLGTGSAKNSVRARWGLRPRRLIYVPGRDICNVCIVGSKAADTLQSIARTRLTEHFVASVQEMLSHCRFCPNSISDQI